MGHINIRQSPLTHIIVSFHKFKFDKYFRLYVAIWTVLLIAVGFYAYQAVLKSIDSYNNPNQHVNMKQRDSIPFPPLVFCASNTDSSQFAPSSCIFAPRGPAREPTFECDAVATPLTLLVFDVKLDHHCVVIRGIKPTTTQPQQQTQTEATYPQQQFLAGRTTANATYPASQFQITFNTGLDTAGDSSSNDTAAVVPFKTVFFHAVIHKTVTEHEADEHRYVHNPENTNPIYVPRSVDAWTRLYPARTEEIVLLPSTTTYLDETVVYKYALSLRPVPCSLPHNQNCDHVISAHIRFQSLEVENAEEEVDFDWLYVLGATGGALTVAELVFLLIHPPLQRLLFGKNEESHTTESEDNTKDPLIS